MRAVLFRTLLALMLASGMVAACDEDDGAEEIGEEIGDAVD